MPRDRGSGDSPAPITPRAMRTITAYHADCQGCEFDTSHPRQAHTHCLATQHVLLETRRYVVEPPK